MKSEDIFKILLHQLRNIFMFSESETDTLLTIKPSIAYENTIECFRHSNCKYFSEEKGLNPYNSVMYTNYLYQVSHLLFKEGFTDYADKVYYLNKMLNAVDLFYAIDLPDHWNCEHPLGSVMGRAKYGDFFFFYQGCTVGGNHMDYPVIGNNVTMFSNSKVLGKSHIGNNVIIAANAYVKDTDIPDNTIVFGQFPNLVLKSNENQDKFWKL